MIFAIIPVPAWAFVPGVILWDGYQLLTNPTVRVSFSFMNFLDLTEYWQTTTDSVAHLGGIPPISCLDEPAFVFSPAFKTWYMFGTGETRNELAFYRKTVLQSSSQAGT